MNQTSRRGTGNDAAQIPLPGNLTKSELQEFKGENTCPHCHHADWCYSLGELTVCNRMQPPAAGWVKTSKCDATGVPYYAPEQKKRQRPQGKEEYIYSDRVGNPLIKVTVVRPGRNSHKDVYQEYWGGVCWVKAKDFPQDKKREYQQNITWYRYADVKEAIANNKSIFIVEGEGVCESLWKLGIAATTTISGAGKYRAYGIYQNDLENASVILCPDRDVPGLKHMEEIYKDFPNAKWLYAPPSNFYWHHLPKSGGLDVKDWVEDGATVDDIIKAIEEKPLADTSLTINHPELESEHSLSIRSKHEYNFSILKKAWGHRLRWNKLSKQVEFDGKWMPLDRIRTRVATELHVDMAKEDAKEIVLELAQKQSYSPVVEYLEQVTSLHHDVSPDTLNTLASRYFGTNNSLHNALLKRTLIAAVARAFEPGCKHDNICILQGEQGSLKSTFWETLASPKWFTDDISSGTEKDEILKLSQYWIMEYSEFETAYRKKEVSTLKAFLSRKSDAVRRPYGTDIEDVLRPSIFVGTTNRSEFLQDPTGERRYWVINVKVNKINIAQLKQERDSIWAAAVLAYKNGEQWHLTNDEENMLRAANGQYQTEDSWENAIASYINNCPFVVVGNILSDVLKIELAYQDRKTEMRVADILRRLGWQKAPKQRRICGQIRWVWEPLSTLSQNVECHNLEGCDEVMTEVMTASNIDTAIISEVVSQPSQPLSENLIKDELATSSYECTNLEKISNTEVVTTEVMTTTPTPQAIEAVITSVITSHATYSPSPDDEEAVQGSAQLLLDAIKERSQEIILVLTQSWSAKFLKAVSALLSLGDKLAIKTLLANNTFDSLSLLFEG